MARSYIPTKDADLVTWSKNFLDRLGNDPPNYGLTQEQKVKFQAVQSAYAAAFETANDSITRSPANIQKKNTARKALVAKTRELVDICQAWPEMTDDKRKELQISLRDNTPTPVPVPSTAPVIDISRVDGLTIKMRLHNGDSTRRAKPAGVKGATLFSYVGDTPPVSLSDWTFEGSVTRTITQLTMPGSVAAGSKVWLTAFWFNTRSESGPATPPISTHVGFGGLSQAA